MAGERFMLTTVDNPYNPFTHYDEWNVFDETEQYYSNALLARIVVSSEELSEADQLLAIELAIDEIIKENVSGMHKKAFPEPEKILEKV